MALVYIGTSRFAADLLLALIERGSGPRLIVSRPDAPQGRGRSLSPPPVAELAGSRGIELLQPADVNDPAVARRVAEIAGDAGAVVLCAFGALIGGVLLEQQPIFNVHPSLLPRWRGAAPIERAIQAGDAQTGVSIMGLVAELDAGPVYGQRTLPIESDDDYGTLSAKLVRLSADLLVEVLDSRPEPVSQAAEGVTYAERIVAADRTIDLSDPELAVRTVRALHPHIGARLQLPDGQLLGIEQARVESGPRLVPERVKPPGGRAMSYEDYVRGHGPIGL